MESRNDYVIQVKGNRKGLYEWIKHTVLTCMPEEVDYTKEKSKGRLENRECYVYKANPEMEGFESCKTIIHIINYGCLLYTSPSPRDLSTSRMPSSA